MYLREMGSIELLSREDEVEIAKRIEAGRNKVLEALCQSPLTMQAIISWREAIGEGKVMLRDVIDLEATYGGSPSEKNGVKPREAKTDLDDGGEKGGAAADSDSATGDNKVSSESVSEDCDDHDESDDVTLSVSAIEASVKDGVIATFDKAVEAYDQLQNLQRLDAVPNNRPVAQGFDANYEKARSDVVGLVNQIQLKPDRVDSLVEQLYRMNRRLNGLEGQLLRLAENCDVDRKRFLNAYRGGELDPDWLERVARLPDPAWKRFTERYPEEIIKI
ncbi:MAG: sigma-70 factor domain-containing protein, partial [Geminicoccaceae bacterium]